MAKGMIAKVAFRASVVIVSGLFAISASAAQPNDTEWQRSTLHGARKKHVMLDSNNDNKISKEEFLKGISSSSVRDRMKQFTLIDSDNSGTLSLDEIVKWIRSAPRYADIFEYPKADYVVDVNDWGSADYLYVTLKNLPSGYDYAVQIRDVDTWDAAHGFSPVSMMPSTFVEISGGQDANLPARYLIVARRSAGLGGAYSKYASITIYPHKKSTAMYSRYGCYRFSSACCK